MSWASHLRMRWNVFFFKASIRTQFINKRLLLVGLSQDEAWKVTFREFRIFIGTDEVPDQQNRLHPAGAEFRRRSHPSDKCDDLTETNQNIYRNTYRYPLLVPRRVKTWSHDHTKRLCVSCYRSENERRNIISLLLILGRNKTTTVSKFALSYCTVRLSEHLNPDLMGSIYKNAIGLGFCTFQSIHHSTTARGLKNGKVESQSCLQEPKIKNVQPWTVLCLVA